MGTVVRLEDYCKSFKSAEVLKNINLTLESGKVIGLKGKNGSGKTMLMRAISGLILPTSGKVYINDKELGRHISFPPSIGILIENPSFISNYTGFKNLKILASIQNRISDDEIRDAIRKVGLDPDDKRTFKKYSLGMKQRLGIAAAIMERPDIVILDEPINALDEAGLVNIPICSYSAKFASGYYGPFRDAAHSAPGFGDRKTYQMDPANGKEALREVEEDILEGADMIIAKPALGYMDVMKEIALNFNIPIVAYNVSGEYAMVKAAAMNGWIDEKKIVMENMTGFKRAGAKMIITYHAIDVAKWLKEE